MTISGLIIAVFCFLCIGVFHPIVIKAEYYFTKKWGVKPKTGGNASFGGAALRNANELSQFMEMYEMNYNSFKENKAKAGL